MPRIEEVIRLWLGTNGYLDSRYDPFGRSISGDLRGIDLGVAQYFTDLATAYYLLDDKLSPAIRKQMQDRTDEWVFSPLFRAYAARDKKEILKFSPVMWWLDGENNWNPYCHTRCVVMAMTMLTSRRERAYVMAHAIKTDAELFKKFYPGRIYYRRDRLLDDGISILRRFQHDDLLFYQWPSGYDCRI